MGAPLTLRAAAEKVVARLARDGIVIADNPDAITLRLAVEAAEPKVNGLDDVDRVVILLGFINAQTQGEQVRGAMLLFGWTYEHTHDVFAAAQKRAFINRKAPTP